MDSHSKVLNFLSKFLNPIYIRLLHFVHLLFHHYVKRIFTIDAVSPVQLEPVLLIPASCENHLLRKTAQSVNKTPCGSRQINLQQRNKWPTLRLKIVKWF